MRRSALNRKAALIRTVVFIIFILAISHDACAVEATSSSATYYVSPTGDNSNPGSRDKPWATPGHASRQLKPGDTLIILGGTYILNRYDDDVITPSSGDANSWITIRGEQGKRPVLAGKDNLLTAVDLSGASYVRLENLEITHDVKSRGEKAYFRDGLEILEKSADHLILKDLHIHHIDEFGLNIQNVHDLQVVDCRLEYCGSGGMGGPAGAAGGWRNVVVKNCRLSHNGHYFQGGDGSNRPYDRPDGFGIEESRGPIEIVGTAAEHNFGDGLDSKAAHTTIRNCIVANNSCDGVKLWGDRSKVENTLIYGTGDGESGDSPWAGLVIHTYQQANASFEIINVTVHDNPARHAYPMYVQYDSSVPLILTMKNCIIANGQGLVHIGDSVKFTAENNIFYRSGEDVQIYANKREYAAGQLKDLGRGNLSKDPLFVSPAWGREGDYHLKNASPAIDAGTKAGAPATDLEGKARPQGKSVDIGVYER